MLYEFNIQNNGYNNPITWQHFCTNNFVRIILVRTRFELQSILGNSGKRKRVDPSSSTPINPSAHSRPINRVQSEEVTKGAPRVGGTEL